MGAHLLDEQVEEIEGCRIRPVRIFEDDQHGSPTTEAFELLAQRIQGSGLGCLRAQALVERRVAIARRQGQERRKQWRDR